MRKGLRTLRYLCEALGIALVLLFFRLLPLDMASAAGGWIMRVFGRFFRAHTIADSNIRTVMPDITAQERHIILRAMWDNLGRVIAEYPHLSRPLMKKRITVDGLEYLEAIRHNGGGAFFVSGHFANWEIAALSAALHGLPLVVVYRAPNNPFADRIVRYMRAPFSRAMYKKGREAAYNLLKAIKQGDAVAMLVDQKMNEGKPIMFLGKTAMTATATTAIAIRQQVPLLLAQVVRTKGAYFHVTLHPPIHYAKDADATDAMQEIHHIFEHWIRQHPEQWFWVHKRWK